MDKEGKGSLLLCFLLLGFASQFLVTPALSRKLEDSTVAKPDCDCATPSHHHSGVPSTPKPTTPSLPSHGSSGSSGSGTPSAPSHGSGGYYPSPTSHSPVTTPTPVTPTPPTPVTPTTPTTPSVPDPSVPPYTPGTCSYWISHPDAVFAIFGYWGTMGESFGAACSAAFGKNISLQDALKNTRSDGIGGLYREGTAALLNSVACKKYSFTTQQVKDAFAAAALSNKAAAAQAEIFRKANQGGLEH